MTLGQLGLGSKDGKNVKDDFWYLLWITEPVAETVNTVRGLIWGY